MTPVQIAGIPLGVYRFYWSLTDRESCVVAVGKDSFNNYWFAPSNWENPPCLDWGKVSRIELLAVNGSEKPHKEDFLRVEKANSYWDMEPCTECGKEYPRVELLDGHTCCIACRQRKAEQNLVAACQALFVLPNWEHRCGHNDIYDALKGLYAAFNAVTRKK